MASSLPTEMVEQLLQADIDAEKMLDRKQKGSAP